MGNVVAFQKKVAKRKKMEWVTTSLLNLNGCYAESQYSPGDPIRVQLRQGDTQVLVEAVIHSQAELDELLDQHAVSLATEARLYYLIRGTVRERWLWLWGADWCESQAEVFKLLQQRFSDNARQEWVFEEEARVIFNNSRNYVLRASTNCDLLSNPAYAAQQPAELTQPFLMAVRNGKVAYQLWLKREEREAEERRQEALRNPPSPPVEEFDLEACIAERTKRYEAHMAYLIENELLQEPVPLGVLVGSL